MSKETSSDEGSVVMSILTVIFEPIFEPGGITTT